MRMILCAASLDLGGRFHPPALCLLAAAALLFSESLFGHVAAASSPNRVYVDAAYPTAGSVGFPAASTNRVHRMDFDAFKTVQAAADHVAPGGVVEVASGTYVENVRIQKPLFLLGPNVGIPGQRSDRKPEARILPVLNDPENTPIVSVETDEVVIDGFYLDGHNPGLTGGYNANGVTVHAAAGIQNGTYPDLADVAAITIRNNVVSNISYDGICLDRYEYFGTSSAWNYIHDNRLVNMWEGLLTYSVDAVIANNVISNVTHGLGVHCVTTASPKGFVPAVCSNTLWIAQWWPVEITASRAPGICINFRWDNASPLDVVGNVVHTPQAAPAEKTILGLYALTIERGCAARFLDNVVDGQGNCTVGLYAASCWSNGAVLVSGGALKSIRQTGVLVDTVDAKWGFGNSFVTVSNLEVSLLPNASGIVALQQPATPNHSAAVQVLGTTRVSGGACGVQVRGANACASVIGKGQVVCGNRVGIDVDAGRALVEGTCLTSNQVAGISVENGGRVDAGDCRGANLTGLGTGSGLNGSSAGLNDLSGYGCDRVEPWAIRNQSDIPVSADRNVFHVQPGEDINNAVAGPVRFSDAALLKVSGPPSRQVQCLSQVPAGAVTVEQFVAAGGVITAGAISEISFRDTVVTNRPGFYSVFREYALKSGCSQTISCVQTITAVDNQPPTLHCSDNIVQGVDPGCDYATVTFTNIATDSCGELLGSWSPVSTGQFPIGTNIVVVIATDVALNSTACSFEVAVVGLPVITRQPVSRTNQVGTSASFSVSVSSASPVSFQWNRNGTVLRDQPGLTGATSNQLTIAAVDLGHVGDYQVEVRNFVGSVSSSKAHLSIGQAPANLRVVECTPGAITLELTGPAARFFTLLTSTNLVEWTPLRTNPAPFIYTHTGAPWSCYRFYRASPVP